MKRSKLTNLALYAAQATHFKCIFETKIMFSAWSGWWLLWGASSDEYIFNLHLMVKCCNPFSFFISSSVTFCKNHVNIKTRIYFEEICEMEIHFIYFLQNFFGVGSYVKYDLQFPEVSGLLLTFNSIAGSLRLYWQLFTINFFKTWNSECKYS